MTPKDGDRATITLNWPGKLNAINDTLFLEMHQALQEAEADKEVKLVIYEGAGRCFSVGVDLSGQDTVLVMPPDPRTRPYLNDIFQALVKRRKVLEAIYDSPKMTLAKVHGHCLGLGLDIANLDMQGLGASFRYATAIQMVNALRQRAGLRPEQFNLFDARDKRGLKAAIEMRDVPFKGLVK